MRSRVHIPCNKPAANEGTTQAPASKPIAEAPAEAGDFLVVSPTGANGHRWVWTLPDGTRMMRQSHSLHGNDSEAEEGVHFGPDGMPDRMLVRGGNKTTFVEERFSASPVG